MGWPVLVPSLGPPAARGCAQLAPLRGPGARLRGAGRRGGSQAAAAQDAGGRFRDLMGFLDGKSIGSIRGYTILDGIFVDFWWEKKTNLFFYLRAAAPAADPGRIGKEAKQIGIKTLRCFAPWGFRPFSYVYCREIYLIGLNFHL